MALQCPISFRLLLFHLTACSATASFTTYAVTCPGGVFAGNATLVPAAETSGAISDVLSVRLTSHLSVARCAVACSPEKTCKSILYREEARISQEVEGECILRTEEGNCTRQPDGFVSLDKVYCCKHSSEWDDVSETCRCSMPWVGQCCERYPQDCSEIYQAYPELTSDHITLGYIIQPDPESAPFETACYLNWGGFTVLMKRDLLGRTINDPDVSFARSLSDYASGFIVNDYNYWLGLDHLYALTSGSSAYKLDVTIYFQTGGGFYQAYYSNFKVGPKEDGYRIDFGSYHINPGLQNGAGDGLSGSENPDLNVLGMKFSALDVDVDQSPTHCALVHNSGWWFNACSGGVLTAPLVNTVDGIRDSNLGPSAFWGPDFENRAIAAIDAKMVRV